MAAMQGDAKVTIKIEVNDTEANRKLTALGQRMRDLDGKNRTTKRGFDDTGKALDKAGKAAGNLAKKAKGLDDKLNFLGRRVKQFKEDMNGVGTLLKSFGSALGGLFKIVKYGVIEFGLMTAALGAMTLTLKTGELLARAWSASVKAMGGAAGVAVAAIATVLGAIRELQVAQLKPLYTGPLTAGLDTSSILGNKRLAMYGESLQAIMGQQLRATGRMDAQFQQRLTRMADFAMGDPKTLQSIAAAFGEMQKQGKVTAEVYSQLQQSSPALAKAFEEMAGGEKQAAAAAAKGSISFNEFSKAMLEGKLKALEPYNGALDDINNTLIGRLKGTLVSVKEDLTQLGLGFLDAFKFPLAEAERDIQTFVMKITPTLQRFFPQLVDRVAGGADGLLGGLLDKLAKSINNNMGNLVGMGGRLADRWRAFKDVLASVADYLRRMEQPFMVIWNNILKPLGSELMTTINFAFEQFANVTNRNAGELKSFGETLHGIFEGVRGLIAALSRFKEVIQPFLLGFMRFASAIGKVLNFDNLVGSVARFMAVFGLLLLVFKKFITSLGFLKNQTVGFMEAMRNLFGRTQQQTAATDQQTAASNKQTSATNQQTAAYTQMAAAIDKVVLSMQRLLAVQTAIATRMGVPNAAQLAAGTAPATPGMTPSGLVLPPGVNLPPQRKPMPGVTMFPGQSPVPLGPPKPAVDAGAAMAKGFKGALGRLQVGHMLAIGMVGTLASSFLASKFDATNAAGQGFAGALGGASMGASIGGMFGPIGMAIGALGGGIIGGVTSWMGANEEEKRRREEAAANARAGVQSIVEQGGLFNTAGDFARVREVLQFTAAQLSGVYSANQKLRDAYAPYKDPNALDPWRSMASGILADRGFTTFTGTDAFGKSIDKMRTPSGEEFYLEGAMYTDEVKKAGAQWIAEVTGSSLEKAIGYVNESTSFELALAGLTDMTAQELDEVLGIAQIPPALLGDLNVSTNEVTKALEELDRKERLRSTNLYLGSLVLGKTATEVEEVFTDMDRSLAEVGVSFSMFNEVMGYTGEVMADLAQGAGRLRDHLLGPVEAIKATAEAENELRSELTKWFELRGNPLSDNDAKIATSNVLGAVVDAQTLALASGDISWNQLVGGATTKVTPTGTTYTGQTEGALVRQLDALVAESVDLPENARTQLLAQVDIIKAQLEAAKTDPFARAQFDAVFAEEFTTLGKAISDEALANITVGMDPQVAIAQGTDKLVAFLQEKGIQVTPETTAALENMIGSEALDMQLALNSAFEEGATTLSEAIKNALAGGPTGPRLPNPNRPGGYDPFAQYVVDPPDTSSRRSARFGDTTASRFRQTMSSHAMFNSGLSGKRTVTSGVRNWGLGSVDSDHTSGAAFDLVGDNLLAYGKNVRDSGGFAEMHGGPDSRHLHVVPSVGDTYSPRPVAARQAAAPAAVAAGPVVVNVYGSEGQSVQALADEVIDRLERKQRSERERY